MDVEQSAALMGGAGGVNGARWRGRVHSYRSLMRHFAGGGARMKPARACRAACNAQCPAFDGWRFQWASGYPRPRVAGLPVLVAALSVAWWCGQSREGCRACPAIRGFAA